MSRIDELIAELPGRLADAAERHGVVGASVAVQTADAVTHAVSGMTNLRTAVPVAEDTIFQIGSITKSYTAVLVMQLVDEGLVELDAPISTYLPDFTIADAAAAGEMTIRQLLSHTSGMDGDVFTDFGRGDDCIEKYVGGMSELAQTSPPGAFFSYCNSGYVLLGRLIERVRGLGWDAALQKHLLAPLGATDTVTTADEAILRSTAVGHLPTGEDGATEVAPVWFMSRALGPAGSIVASAGDVLRFARMLADDGRAADGTQVLSPASTKSMRDLQVRMQDPYTLGDGWGLGVILYRAADPIVIGHDGTTIGQQAYLRILPDANIAITLLTNGGGSGALFDELINPLLTEIVGAPVSPPATPPDVPLEVDPTSFLGSFERSGVRLDVTRDEAGVLWLKAIGTGPLAGTLPDEPPQQLSVFDTDTLITTKAEPRLGKHLTVKFFDPGDAGFRYLHFGGRATPRVDR